MSGRPFFPGELVMVDIRGTSLDKAQAAFLRDHHIRAVCLFRGNLGTEAEVRRLTADLRDAMGEHALIGLDQEGGSVVRATFLPQPPAAMALGAAGDETLAEDVGAAVSRGLRSLGINWNFAPVLDVNNNPANPVIAERSFSEDPQQVVRLAGAWMRGALREGVACCVKHFPGHGDTHVDSHHDLPVVDKPLEALRALEFLPFEALKDAAPAMMTAHIVYPQLDPDHPATLSRRILGELLRERWGYDGVVITDSLVMKAIHARYGHHRAAVLTLQAGADMAMALGAQADQAAALQAIAEAQASGALALTQLLRARDRLDGLAARFPAQAGDYASAQRDSDDRLMRAAWAAGLTAVGAPVPPRRDEPLRVFTQRSVPCDGVSEAGPGAEDVARLFAGFDDVELVQLGDLQELDWARIPRDGRLSVLASNHRGRYAASRQWRPDLHLVLWNPFQSLDIDAPSVITWGYATGALDALRAWLEGRAVAPGRSPVRLQP
ncbi:beta-N-acetylhexosaminidase [Piscinibacter sp. XHJ-5]|uniref:beta-N-acetylhexosaminidase n=1 Tax=Piscinibacter sp. XHJ-5 TaxID=3037797 RepID=UPI00245282C0|nr:beta-N-acetylhexosaminidase [Piscinibacter sp. XHJ-5]